MYNGKEIRMMDEIPVLNRDAFAITIEKCNSEWKQGISLVVNGIFQINKQRIKRGILLWQDTAPRTSQFKLSLNKPGKLIIKNVWDTGNGVIESWHHGAGIIVEEIKNGKRYHCNDGHPDDNFDDIVFIITKITGNTSEQVGAFDFLG